MKRTALTTAEIRRYNRSQIYKAIYTNKQISKQGIGYELQLSLPTVTQNLSELQEAGLIEICGASVSTGGRKAQLHRCIADARIAFGVSIFKRCVQVVEVDLYGSVLAKEQYDFDFENNTEYFEKICALIQRFILNTQAERNRILGVGVAIQGLVSHHGDRILFGKILDNSNVTLEYFTRYLDYPCILLHDAEAAAAYELWERPDIKDAAFLLLNRNLGGALIMDGAIHSGPFLTSGIFEHMCLVPGGNLCYCGQRGCLETYCSAEALMRDAGAPLEDFFEKVRSGAERERAVWDEYLHNLALAINNILMVVNCDVILGGLLSPYLVPEDLEKLRKYVRMKSAFDFFNSYLMSKSITNTYAEPIGAALHYVKSFLDQV